MICAEVQMDCEKGTMNIKDIAAISLWLIVEETLEL